MSEVMSGAMITATTKNLLMLTRFEERMLSNDTAERYEGHPVLTVHDLWPGEHYHAERLVRLGFLKKTKSRAPWNGRVPVTMYYVDETCHANTFPFQGMSNKRMQEKLAGGEAIDLSACTRSAAGEYLLGQVTGCDLACVETEREALKLAARDTLFAEGKDYCDARLERWIWSIGLDMDTGLVWASLAADKYRAPGFVCLWLR